MPSLIHLTPFYLPHVGGVEEHVSQLNHELRKRGYLCEVICLQHDSQLAKNEIIDDVIVHRLPVNKDPGSSASTITKTIYKMRTWLTLLHYLPNLIKADIVHIHDVFWWLWPFLLFIPKKKRFITFHGYEGNQDPNQKQIAAHQKAAHHTQANLCIGGFHQKWYGVKPTAISFGAINPSLFANFEKNQLNSSQQIKSQKITFIGRLQEDIGIMAYLETLELFLTHQKHQLQPVPTNLHLDVYGDGPLRNSCEEYVQTHNLPVTFYGFIPDAAQQLAHSDLAFVSSYLAILEALAVGVPVMAHSNSDIKKDYLKNTPFHQWITTFSTPKKGAQLLLHPTELPSEAIKWARQQTWSQMANIYQQLWQQK